jgi:hypothetical protein
MGIWYRAGTASVANGSAAVTGVGTTWLVSARIGDRITFDGGGKWYEIEAIPSNTSITLATNFAETTIAPPGSAYAIDPSSYRHQIPTDILEQMRLVLANQTSVYEVDALPPNDFGADENIAVDFAGLDLYYKSAGSWLGPIPMAYGDALRFKFATSTTMGEPGVGYLRFNNATVASVTAIAIDDQDAGPGTPDVSAAILAWDDSTTLTHRGLLTIRKRNDPEVFATFRVSGNSTDNSGWTQLAVTHLASVGAFAADDILAVSFQRTGNAGDVSGPASSVTGRVAIFDGTTGKVLVDGGETIAEIKAAVLATIRNAVASDYDTLAELASGKVDKAAASLTGTILQTGTITPSALTANVNDYAPTDFATCSRLVISGDAAWRIITGLAGGADGRRVIIRNGGAHPIILSGENALSTAVNRFLFGGVSLVLMTGELCELLYDGAASRWVEITGIAGSRKARRLASDTVNNNATANTLANLPELSFWMEADKSYEFRIKCPYNAAVTTTGSRWTVNGPAGPTLIQYKSDYTLTATTLTTNYGRAYQLPAASNATSVAANNLAVIEGVVRNGSTAGLLQAQFASEISSSAITALAAGSIIEWREVA